MEMGYRALKTLLFSLVISVSAFAQNPPILVVSDIDDTLKISHVLSKVDMVSNASRYENHFRGMSEIFVKLEKAQGDLVEFVYVTNAPKNLMESYHRMFIAMNGFPLGNIYLKDGLSSDQHKLVTIQKLINEKKPSYVVLVGDNGEKDPVFYSQIVKNNPKIEFLTLIHRVYTSKAGAKERGSPLYPGQLSYVTGVEVAEEFLEAKLIDQDSFDSYILALAPEISREKMTGSRGTLAFPKWMNCSDHFSFIGPGSHAKNVLNELNKYYSVRAKRCAK